MRSNYYMAKRQEIKFIIHQITRRKRRRRGGEKEEEEDDDE